jgi:coenzyme F420-reducing hydrogenase delta subunit/ferredoxin
MLFVLLHALKLFFARRFGGARWLAWVTGAFLVGTLWCVGWFGYWLVWDERARQIALGSARALDAVPIFADPLARSFLADDTVNSLLFFVVFFVHMLVPLAMGIALWLHITRLSRPSFLTKRGMTIAVVAVLSIISFALPADLAAPAKMALTPAGFRMDAWFLAPLALTDRLGATALWVIAIGVGVLVYAAPWMLARGRARVAEVNVSRCNACRHCYEDCPYDAIRMVPRTDARRFDSMAQVDVGKCLGCGICAGSCDSAAIGLPTFDALRARARIDRWLDTMVGASGASSIAFLCSEAAGATLRIDDAGVCDELPGYRVMRVPCAGWVQARTVERALRHGARGVLVVSCGGANAMYREGPKWTNERLNASREPALDRAKFDPRRVRVVSLRRFDTRALVREAEAFRRGAPASASERRAPRAWLGAAAVAIALGGATWGASRVGYALPHDDAPQLVASFKHPGRVEERCRELSPEEAQKLPVHMRQSKKCERRRFDVRMRVAIDGHVVSDKTYEPAGLWKDGNSIAIERFRVSPGDHAVRVEIFDDGGNAAAFSTEKTLPFAQHAQSVVRFDKLDGFQWR